MKIDKITFKNDQAWLVIRDDDGNYLGTWHIVNSIMVNVIRDTMPTDIEFKGNKK